MYKMRLLYVLVIFVALVSCDQYKREQAEKRYYEARKSELSKNVRNDTIFLGYYFGMTEREFVDYTLNLKKEGKIYLNLDDIITYEMEIPDYSKSVVYCTYQPKYFKDKLYKLSISAKDRYTGFSKLTQLQIVSIYSQKYGTDYHIIPGYIEDSEDFIFLNGNLEVEITQGYDDIRIIYTDNLVEMDALKYELEQDDFERKKLKDSLKNDI